MPSRCKSRQQRLKGVAVMSKAPSVTALRCVAAAHERAQFVVERAVGPLAAVRLMWLSWLSSRKTDQACSSRSACSSAARAAATEALAGGQQNLEPAGHGLSENAQKLGLVRALGRAARTAAGT